MRTFRTIVAAVVALSVLGACSSGTSDEPSKATTTAPAKTTTTEAPGVAVEKWASTFCGSLGTWLNAIKTASDAADEDAKVGDVASLKTATGGVYGTMSTATRTLIEQIEAQDPPDIDDGEAFQQDLVERYQVVDDAALDVQEQIAALPTNDLAAAQAKIDELGADFQTTVEDASSSFDQLRAKYPSKELSAAIKASCVF